MRFFFTFELWNM